MATKRHPNLGATTPLSASGLVPVISSTAIRALIAATITLSLVLVLVLAAAATRSYAASMFGTLRAPGEAAVIAGHRGDRSVAPENTMPSFEQALAGPMLFVETDVHLSADGVPVLIHDDTVDRTTNGTGAVADLTLAELKALDAGSWYDASYAGTTIPTLDEFLDLFIGSTKKAIIELKGVWTDETVMLVDDLVRIHGAHSRIVLTSFELDTMAALRDNVDLPRVLLSKKLPSDPVATVTEYGAIALFTNAKAIEKDPAVVDVLHQAGLGVLLYTLNKERNWKDALALGVDGIVTDQPSALDGWLAESSPGT